MDQEQPKRIRRYASTFGILILLAAVLGFYYFKYVPERRTEYNQAAFLELNQIEYALQHQNRAYDDALQNIIHQDSIDSKALLKFNLQPANYSKFYESDKIKSGRFNFIDDEGEWHLLYPVYNLLNPVYNLGATTRDYETTKRDHITTKHDHDTTKHDHGTIKPNYTLSKNADTLMSGIVSTYKDIFDGYLLIDNEDSIDGEFDKGQIIFQSGDLYMNDNVDPDSILKKKDGFSLNDLQDVTIGGNANKIFLYPFEMESQKLILVGLISDSKYREANLKIPFSFFSVFIVMVLLLVIHLPILRIYILGPSERVRERDIRLIIGSYFVAAFFGFFLFTKIFLNRDQTVQNRKNIKKISDKIIGNFQAELGLINRQLCSFDSTLKKLRGNQDSDYLKSMSSTPTESGICFLDALFKPSIYPFPTNVFWINDNGQWVARWVFKKALIKAPMISVADRSYFKDFQNNEPLLIDGVDSLISIQPTLSKLEGEYSVTVAKRSTVQPYQVVVPLSHRKQDKGHQRQNKKDTVLNVAPYLIGITTEMHSVNNVVMPPGYNFSIIDESGNILYDSKSGRPLLSNIYKEMENHERIQQSALYRNTRYFESLRLRSRDMALLSTPITGMPYQLLVYYNKSRSDEFEEHLITISSVLIGAVICLVIFSSLINRWSKNKNRMLESRSHHFEWLYPSDDFLKQKYYLYLIRWMLLLSGVYLLAWVFMEVVVPRTEFYFLFISLLFPLYITVFYYELRERYYDVQEMRTEVNWYFARPSIALRGSLLVIIILINCCITFFHFTLRLAWPVLFIQVIWVAMIMLSTIRFRHYMMIEINPSDLDSKVCDYIYEDDPPGNKIELPVVRSFWFRLIESIQSVIFLIATYEFKKDKTDIQALYKSTLLSDKRGKTESTHKISTNFIWAILIGVTLVSVVPAFGLFWMFFRQETALYQHTDELIISKEINQRAGAINQNLKEFKYETTDPKDQSNISKLKFSDGIYMISGKIIADSTKTTDTPLCYPAKEYIRLHDHLFRDDSLVLDWTRPTYAAADESWSFVKESADGFSKPELRYNKRRDGITPGPFRLTSSHKSNWNTSKLIRRSFSRMGAPFCIFFLVGLCFSLAIAYFLTLSLARRIFLVELQQVVGQVNYSNNQASKLYQQRGIPSVMRSIMLDALQQGHRRPRESYPNEIKINDSWKPDLHDIYLFEKKLPLYKLEAMMPSLIDTLEPVYCNLWNKLSARHKFILFDFAQDGFANYKAGKDLQALIEKGILFFDGQRLSVMTLSFQEYIIQMKDDAELNGFLNKAKKEDTWKKIQTPLLVLLMAAGIFIFATQEEVYKKITGLLTSISSLLPLLTGMFGKSSGKSADS